MASDFSPSANFKAPLHAKSNADDGTDVALWADPTTHRLLADVEVVVPAPEGGATEAVQTDGTQKTQIVDGSGNVIGSTSNALDVNIASGSSAGTEYTEDAAAAANPDGGMLMAVRADSLAGVTSADGDNIALRATNNGELYVKQTDAIPVTDNGGALTVDGTVTANLSATDNTVLDNIDADTTTIAGDTTSIDGKITACDTGNIAGTVTANLSATDNAVLDSIDADTSTIAGDTTSIDGKITACNTGNVTIGAALPAGTNAIGKLAANSGVDIGDVDVTSISAGSNLIGDVGIQGRITGGLSTYYDNDLDEAAIAVKAGAGTVYAIEAFNTTDAPLFLQLFNVAQGSVTVGTTTPTNQWVIPGNASSDGAGFTFNVPQGIAYGTAITAACTTNSQGNSAPGAGACIVNIHFK